MVVPVLWTAACSQGFCVTKDTAQGSQTRFLKALLTNTALSKTPASLLPHLQAERKKVFFFLFSVWFLIFVLRFCSASLSLSASKLKPAVFVCGSFISMKPVDCARLLCVLNNQEGDSHGHKGRTGVKKTSNPQTSLSSPALDLDDWE